MPFPVASIRGHESANPLGSHSADWFYENFAGASGASAHSRIPPVRPNTNIWNVTNGSLLLTGASSARSNHAAGGNGAGTVDVGNADVTMTGRFKAPSTGTWAAGVTLRMGASSGNAIRFVYQHSTHTLRMTRVVSGTQQAPEDTPLSITALVAGTWYDFSATVAGASWSFTVDGQTTTYSGANATYNQTATRHGFYVVQTQGEVGVEIAELSMTPVVSDTLTVSAVPMTGRLTHGMDHVNVQGGSTPFWMQAGWADAKANIAACIGAHDSHLAQFGLSAAWNWDGVEGHKPALPTFTGSGNQVFERAMIEFRNLSASEPIIVTCYAMSPWWCHGKLLAGQVTEVNTVNQIRDNSRVMNSGLADWEIYVREAAQVALAPPYNARMFAVWNEMKGFNDPDDGQFDLGYTAGTPGDHADVGYAWLYKVASDGIYAAADTLGIAHGDIKIGGPYNVLYTVGGTSGRVAIGHFLRDRAWGSGQSKEFSALETFLDLVVANDLPLDFIAVDCKTHNVDAPKAGITDWTNLGRWTDWCEWIHQELAERSLDPDMPIVITEYYSKPMVDMTLAPTLYTAAQDRAYRAAIQAETLKNLLLSGREIVALSWGPQGEAMNPTGGELYANGAWVTPDITASGASTLTEIGAALKAFKDIFPSGTTVYPVTGSTDVDGLANEAGKVLLWNRSEAAKTVRLGARVYPLARHEVKVVDR